MDLERTMLRMKNGLNSLLYCRKKKYSRRDHWFSLIDMWCIWRLFPQRCNVQADSSNAFFFSLRICSVSVSPLYSMFLLKLLQLGLHIEKYHQRVYLPGCTYILSPRMWTKRIVPSLSPVRSLLLLRRGVGASTEPAFLFQYFLVRWKSNSREKQTERSTTCVWWIYPGCQTDEQL